MSLGPYVSAAALVLGSFLVLMWSRSYDRSELFHRMDRGDITSLGSNKGTIYFFRGRTNGAFGPTEQDWKHTCSKVNDRSGPEYQFVCNQQRIYIKSPYRTVVPLVALIGVAPWIRSKRSLIDAALIALPHVAGIIARLH